MDSQKKTIAVGLSIFVALAAWYAFWPEKYGKVSELGYKLTMAVESACGGSSKLPYGHLQVDIHHCLVLAKPHVHFQMNFHWDDFHSSVRSAQKHKSPELILIGIPT